MIPPRVAWRIDAALESAALYCDGLRNCYHCTAWPSVTDGLHNVVRPASIGIVRNGFIRAKGFMAMPQNRSLCSKAPVKVRVCVTQMRPRVSPGAKVSSVSLSVKSRTLGNAVNAMLTRAVNA